MKKTVNKWKAYLELSPKEAWGTALLALGLIGLTALLSISDYLFRGDPVHISQEDSLRVMTWLMESDKTNSFTPSKTFKTTWYSGPAILVEKVTHEQLVKMGLPSYLAERWMKYRTKGGRITQIKDVERLYGMTPELVNRIQPFLIFKKKEADYFQESPNFKNDYSSSPKQKQPKVPSRFDINIADTTQWKTLPGIGSGYARRICSFRDKLGGFIRVEQVMETYQLPPELAPVILRYGYIGEPHQKIQINQVMEIKHPYLPYNQAKAIIAYRTQHGPYHSLDQLKQIKRLTPEIIEKIAPYLSFEP